MVRPAWAWTRQLSASHRNLRLHKQRFFSFELPARFLATAVIYAYKDV